jgi:hypothetical protein
VSEPLVITVGHKRGKEEALRRVGPALSKASKVEQELRSGDPALDQPENRLRMFSAERRFEARATSMRLQEKWAGFSAAAAALLALAATIWSVSGVMGRRGPGSDDSVQAAVPTHDLRTASVAADHPAVPSSPRAEATPRRSPRSSENPSSAIRAS